MMSAEGVCYRICQVCYGAFVGFRKGLLCGLCVIHMKLQVCIGGLVIHQQLNKLRGVSLLGILQECGELGRMMPWVIKSQEKRNPVGFYAFRCI
jgi:hypothetical protein